MTWIAGVIFLLIVFAASIRLIPRIFDKTTTTHDVSSVAGLGGLLLMGATGWLSFVLGLIPGSLRIPFFPILVLALMTGGLYFLTRKTAITQVRVFQLPTSTLGKLSVIALFLMALMAIVSCLTPSDMLDWDSLAYHLAVPKIWVQSGQIEFIPFIHHSNFPFAVDSLFLIDATGGGPGSAKLMTLGFAVFGVVALFGLTRQRYNENAAWFVSLAFAAIPVVLWEAGTAYIDIAHGLYSGLGVLILFRFLEHREKADLTVAILLLGFSVSSKYTGLQVVFAGVLAAALMSIRSEAKSSTLKSIFLIAVCSTLIGAPWFLRNVINVGNPVYPFFYESLGGKNWNEFNAKIYKEEQQTFGVAKSESGGKKISEFPHAVLGLAYQPGRYVNPAQTEGGGFPTGALGFLPFVVLLLTLAKGRPPRYESGVLLSALLMLGMWFFLSQQSRYGLNFAIPLIGILGGLLTWAPIGNFLKLGVGLQMAYSMYMVWTTTTSVRLPVLIGKVSADEFQQRSLPLAKPAVSINQQAKSGKVALYEEVFGYLLDVPYFWANPGHSTVIPYEKMNTGEDLATELKSLGFTHVYLNFGFWTQEDVAEWVTAAGFDGSGNPFSTDRRQLLMSDLRTKWRVLLAEAVAAKKLEISELFDRSVLFKLP